tara:strand:- start:1187 stop:2326 length:1140 start_codon:yes stop_codon:yes gene_type:complete
MKVHKNPHIAIIGGGFYGCCLALFLRSITSNITLIEKRKNILLKASKNNQARVHTGFHYPRSIITAARSMQLHRRFTQNFSDSITSDVTMLYAIAKNKSKISSKRFHKIFKDLGAKIKIADPKHRKLFNENMIEDVFECKENIFDYSILKEILQSKLEAANVNLILDSEVVKINDTETDISLVTNSGNEIKADNVFNITYSGLNEVLLRSNLERISLKHQLTEIALISLPESLKKIGITVMDGPFMSVIPFPSSKESVHSLTHVRYTPHKTWYDRDSEVVEDYQKDIKDISTRHRHMILDGIKFIPELVNSEWKNSIYEIKSLFHTNQTDDGRPILYRKDKNNKVISVLGGKIDNIYDLFEKVKSENPFWSEANDNWLL